MADFVFPMPGSSPTPVKPPKPGPRLKPIPVVRGGKPITAAKVNKEKKKKTDADAQITPSDVVSSLEQTIPAGGALLKAAPAGLTTFVKEVASPTEKITREEANEAGRFSPKSLLRGIQGLPIVGLAFSEFGGELQKSLISTAKSGVELSSFGQASFTKDDPNSYRNTLARGESLLPKMVEDAGNLSIALHGVGAGLRAASRSSLAGTTGGAGLLSANKSILRAAVAADKFGALPITLPFKAAGKVGRMGTQFGRNYANKLRAEADAFRNVDPNSATAKSLYKKANTWERFSGREVMGADGKKIVIEPGFVSRFAKRAVFRASKNNTEIVSTMLGIVDNPLFKDEPNPNAPGENWGSLSDYEQQAVISTFTGRAQEIQRIAEITGLSVEDVAYLGRLDLEPGYSILPEGARLAADFVNHTDANPTMSPQQYARLADAADRLRVTMGNFSDQARAGYGRAEPLPAAYDVPTPDPAMLLAELEKAGSPLAEVMARAMADIPEAGSFRLSEDPKDPTRIAFLKWVVENAPDAVALNESIYPPAMRGNIVFYKRVREALYAEGARMVGGTPPTDGGGVGSAPPKPGSFDPNSSLPTPESMTQPKEPGTLAKFPRQYIQNTMTQLDRLRGTQKRVATKLANIILKIADKERIGLQLQLKLQNNEARILLQREKVAKLMALYEKMKADQADSIVREGKIYTEEQLAAELEAENTALESLDDDTVGLEAAADELIDELDALEDEAVATGEQLDREGGDSLAIEKAVEADRAKFPESQVTINLREQLDKEIDYRDAALSKIEKFDNEIAALEQEISDLKQQSTEGKLKPVKGAAPIEIDIPKFNEIVDTVQTNVEQLHNEFIVYNPTPAGIKNEVAFRTKELEGTIKSLERYIEDYARGVPDVMMTIMGRLEDLVRAQKALQDAIRAKTGTNPALSELPSVARREDVAPSMTPEEQAFMGEVEGRVQDALIASIEEGIPSGKSSTTEVNQAKKTFDTEYVPPKDDAAVTKNVDKAINTNEDFGLRSKTSGRSAMVMGYKGKLWYTNSFFVTILGEDSFLYKKLVELGETQGGVYRSVAQKAADVPKSAIENTGGQVVEVSKLLDPVDKSTKGSPPAQIVGINTLNKDGLIVVIQNKDGVTVGVQKKYLDAVLKTGHTLHFVDGVKPIAVRDAKGNLVGAIMPMRGDWSVPTKPEIIDYVVNNIKDPALQRQVREKIYADPTKDSVKKPIADTVAVDNAQKIRDLESSLLVARQGKKNNEIIAAGASQNVAKTELAYDAQQQQARLSPPKTPIAIGPETVTPKAIDSFIEEFGYLTETDKNGISSTPLYYVDMSVTEFPETAKGPLSGRKIFTYQSEDFIAEFRLYVNKNATVADVIAILEEAKAQAADPTQFEGVKFQNTTMGNAFQLGTVEKGGTVGFIADMSDAGFSDWNSSFMDFYNLFMEHYADEALPEQAPTAGTLAPVEQAPPTALLSQVTDNIVNEQSVLNRFGTNQQAQGLVVTGYNKIIGMNEIRSSSNPSEYWVIYHTPDATMESFAEAKAMFDADAANPQSKKNYGQSYTHYQGYSADGAVRIEVFNDVTGNAKKLVSELNTQTKALKIFDGQTTQTPLQSAPSTPTPGLSAIDPVAEAANTPLQPVEGQLSVPIKTGDEALDSNNYKYENGLETFDTGVRKYGISSEDAGRSAVSKTTGFDRQKYRYVVRRIASDGAPIESTRQVFGTKAAARKAIAKLANEDATLAPSIQPEGWVNIKPSRELGPGPSTMPKPPALLAAEARLSKLEETKIKLEAGMDTKAAQIDELRVKEAAERAKLSKITPEIATREALLGTQMITQPEVRAVGPDGQPTGRMFAAGETGAATVGQPPKPGQVPRMAGNPVGGVLRPIEQVVRREPLATTGPADFATPADNAAMSLSPDNYNVPEATSIEAQADVVQAAANEALIMRGASMPPSMPLIVALAMGADEFGQMGPGYLPSGRPSGTTSKLTYETEQGATGGFLKLPSEYFKGGNAAEIYDFRILARRLSAEQLLMDSNETFRALMLTKIAVTPEQMIGEKRVQELYALAGQRALMLPASMPGGIEGGVAAYAEGIVGRDVLLARKTAAIFGEMLDNEMKIRGFETLPIKGDIRGNVRFDVIDGKRPYLPKYAREQVINRTNYINPDVAVEVLNKYLQVTKKTTSIFKDFTLPLSVQWQIGDIIGIFVSAAATGVNPLVLVEEMNVAFKNNYGGGWRDAFKKEAERQVTQQGKKLSGSGLQDVGLRTEEKQRLSTTTPGSEPLSKVDKVPVLGKVKAGARWYKERAYMVNDAINRVGRQAYFMARLEQALGKLNKMHGTKYTVEDVTSLGLDKYNPRQSFSSVQEQLVHQDIAKAWEDTLDTANEVMGDWNDLSPWERKYVLPHATFYAWIKHVNKLFLKIARENPKAIVWQMYLGQLAYDPDTDPLGLMAGKTKLPFGAGLMDTNFANPFADTADLYGGLAERGTTGAWSPDLSRVFGMASPMPRILFAGATGLNLTSMTPLSRQSGEGSPNKFGSVSANELGFGLRNPGQFVSYAAQQFPLIPKLMDVAPTTRLPVLGTQLGPYQRYDTGGPRLVPGRQDMTPKYGGRLAAVARLLTIPGTPTSQSEDAIRERERLAQERTRAYINAQKDR